VLVPVPCGAVGSEKDGEDLVGGVGVLDLDLSQAGVDGLELVVGAKDRPVQLGHRSVGVC
jgi:hypothetical protein